MQTFLAKRLATFAITLAAAAVVIFVVLEILPGNAAQVIMGPEATPETVAALAHKLGLDQPPATRFVEWIAGMLHGDFGVSYAYGTPVADLVGGALAVTLPLAALAMLLNVVLGLALGTFAATHRNRLGDVAVMGLSQIGIAVPSFWFAILLILLFAVRLGWFPAGGFPGWDEGAGAALKSLMLPAVSLAAVQAAVLARTTRAAILEVAREDFVRTARAKGLSRRGALWHHVLRNAMIPIVTIMGLQLSNLIVLTIVIENVFYLPGLGQLIFHAIANRDVIVVRDTVMLLVAVVLVVNFAVDLLYAAIDPRLKASDI